MSHKIESVTFIPRTNDGPLVCTCRWIGLASRYQEHRSSKGEKTVYVDEAAYDPERSGHWDNAPAVQGRMPQQRESTEAWCISCHGARWRVSADGRRRCLDCDAKRAKRRRAAA